MASKRMEKWNAGSLRLGSSLAAVALLMTLGVAGCGPSQQRQTSQEQPTPSPQGDTWDSIAELPDWSGQWLVDAIPSPVTDDAAVVPLTPEFAKKLAGARASVKAGDPIPNNLNECEPDGMPSMMEHKDMLYQFLFTPGRVTIVPEDNQVRRIYTAGAMHPKDPDLTYSGDSVGHWEGGTLIVDTIALLPQLPMFAGFVGDGNLHVVERMHLKDPNTLQIDTTITDTSLTMPYQYTTYYTRHKDMDMQEKLCIPKGYEGP